MATVQEYYDNNTSLFLKLGQTKEAQNIHRLVWGPGVTTKVEAINYVNKLITQLISSSVDNKLNILDLGCGVGATMSYIASNSTPGHTIEGLTISKKQTEIGTNLLSNLTTESTVEIRQGDFHDLSDYADKSLIYQIESFVHSDQPEKLLDQITETLHIGGRYVLCDDFLVTQDGITDRNQRLIEDFKEGWHIGNLNTVNHIVELASSRGLRLVDKTDLTSYLNTYSSRDRFIGIFTDIYNKLPFKSVYWESLRGGDALQRSTKRGLIKYWFLVFEK